MKMLSKILIVLLFVVCVLSCTACNILDMASQTVAKSNSEMALQAVLLLNDEAANETIFFLVYGDKDLAFAYKYRRGELKLYDGDLPIVDSNDLVYTNPQPTGILYDYSATQNVQTDTDIVKNLLVIIPID